MMQNLLELNEETVIPILSGITVIDSGKPFLLPEDLKKEIADDWKILEKKVPTIFNGPVYSAVSAVNIEGQVTLECDRSNYAHYRYNQKNDMGAYTCHNVFAGCVPITRDGYLVYSHNGHGTELDGQIQGIGGAIDPEDKGDDDSLLLPGKTAFRELREEVGTEISESIKEVKDKYLLTNGRKFGIAIFAESDMTCDEMRDSFLKFIDQTGNDEVADLVFVNRDNFTEIEHRFKDSHDLCIFKTIRHVLEL